ncbi:MarR family winged helix-turn-helix transcriptional regulator [Quadrisphaera sp. INWT6]|uniref:MarR family winged helix-turn-helix transcriptional regulator n=1 Tax=Quadrisphaera sp. INWT6 TaxID=2596917 RepID=UPI0019D63AB0|nr:MarR family winged helix-turn-helix transcriptional regulator [Quadrisphaera sp. INWT6]
MGEAAHNSHPSRPPHLQGEELTTWSGLATVLEWLPALLDAQLRRDADLTHFEYGVLFALAKAPERRLRMSVLAGYANSSLTRLSRAVTRLEGRGYAERAVDDDDGRYTLAQLTDAGSAAFEAATPGHTALVRQLVLDALTEEQRSQLREISESILAAAGPGTPWPGTGR